jgi:hypothetical protein
VTETPQQSPHVHVYKPKGGFVWWAECECGEKLNRGNGVVVGSRQKLERELASASAV